MARRSKKASNGKYYRIRKEYEEEFKLLKGDFLRPFHSLLPQEWWYCWVIIEECTKKEADWVIQEGEICPYCSKKECSGEIGRTILRKEFWEEENKLKPWMKEIYGVEGWRSMPYRAFHFIKFVPINSNPDDLKGDFCFDLYQCYIKRENFYLIEVPRGILRDYEYRKKFYVDNWVKKNRICPHCGASYNKLVKEQDFKNEEDILKSPSVDAFYKDTVRDVAIMTEIELEIRVPKAFLKADIPLESGIYRCKTCRRTSVIIPDESKFYK